MRNNTPIPVYKENKTEALQNNIIYYVVSCFFLYIISQIIDVIFAPLKIISKEEAQNRLEETIDEKIRARKNRVFDDPNDPMNQFRFRFIEKRPEYKRDKKNNDMYYQWFQAWKNGEIIDSDLRWAPTAIDFGNENLNDNFVQYMKIQYLLHKKAGLFRRTFFLHTIYKYYPELSANMKGLENDLANYDEENNIIKAKEELIEEIQKFGLSYTTAKYLAEEDISPKELQKKAKLIKSNIEKGYSEEACILLVKHNLNEIDIEVIEQCVKYTYPEALTVAYLTDVITHESVSEIIEELNDLTETFGVDYMSDLNWEGKTVYQDHLEIEIEKHRTKNIASKLNKKVR